MTTPKAKDNTADFHWYIASLAISPPVFIAASFGVALLLTQLIAPGTTGAEALVLSAVVIGLLGGFCVARFNPKYALTAALYSASFSGLLYLSLRFFILDAPVNLMSSGFLLIIPASLLGGYTANKLNNHLNSL